MNQETSTDEVYRRKFRDIIAKIIVLDEIEAEHKQMALDFIDSDAPILRSENSQKHFVCYFILFDKEIESIFLIDHIKSGRTLPTGGHVEKGEMPVDTVYRELKEELGMTADIYRIGEDNEIPFFFTVCETVGPTAGHFDYNLWYLVDMTTSQSAGSSRDLDREATGSNWYHLKTLEKELGDKESDPNIFRFRDKLLEALKDH